MSKSVIEAGLTVTGALVGATGAALIEPLVIVAAVVIAGIALGMRVNDRISRVSETPTRVEISDIA